MVTELGQGVLKQLLPRDARNNPTWMGSNLTTPAMPVNAPRQLPSWIDAFVDWSDHYSCGSPKVWRKWTAISLIGAAIEQKVWICSPTPCYPNLYVWLIGAPGKGKTRLMTAAELLYKELPKPYLAPTSLTDAALVDYLSTCRRERLVPREEPFLYNSAYMLYDEINAFLSSFKDAEKIIPLITSWYDPKSYEHKRRGGDIHKTFSSPQLNMLCGAQPRTLMQLVPDYAWGQGLMSRVIMVYSNLDSPVTDIFDTTGVDLPPALSADYCLIARLVGELIPTLPLREALIKWRTAGEELPGYPKPTHPKLEHYNTRRRQFLLKLMIVSAVNRCSAQMDLPDFNQAMSWLLEAEIVFPNIFDDAATVADSSVQDEVCHFIAANDHGQGVKRSAIINYIRKRSNVHVVMKLLDLMVQAEQIIPVSIDRHTGQPYFKIKGSGLILP